MGLCQLERLRNIGIPDHQVNTVIEIARHIRDEASKKVDAAFDENAQCKTVIVEAETEDSECCSTSDYEPVTKESCGCTPTAGGQSCC